MNKMGKMMLMTSRGDGDNISRKEDRRSSRNDVGSMRYDENGEEMNYPRVENRGGQGVQNNREPYYGEDSDDIESRFRDRQGRERYNDGRYAPRNGYDNPEMNRYPMTPYIPPLYDRENREGIRSNHQPRNAMPVSGFGWEPPKSHYQRGGEPHEGMTRMGEDQWEVEPLTEETAKKCLDKMKNEDGSTGPHWTLEQIKQVMAQKMLPGDPLEMWVAMNMMWSDYYMVAKKFNVNNTDFYLELAKAFLHDKDAGDMKLEKYLEWVVK